LLTVNANHGTALRQSWTAKGKQGLNFIVGQSEIKDVKAVSHVSDICCTGEGQHPKLESETIDYLRNCLIIMVAIWVTHGFRRACRFPESKENA